MRIAICDDEPEELSHLQELVKKYDAHIDVSLFLSAESLLDSIERQRCDVVFLNIEMGGLNGFDAAKKLTGMRDPPLIAFVTNSGEHVYRGYGVAFKYMIKPISFQDLSEALSAAKDKIKPYKFIISINGRTHIIPICEISHIESSGHKLAVHTKSGMFDCRMKLGEAEELLPSSAFAAPHKGYLVNLDFVHISGKNEVFLVDGIRIPVSRRCRHGFEDALFRFVRRHQ